MKVNFLKKKTALADTKVTLARAFGLLLALALAFSLVALPALATPIPSHAFAGAVYVTNAPGQPAVPEGTVVTAEIGGVQYGDPLLGESYGTVNSEGNYGYPFWSFNVPGDDAGTVEKEGGVQLEDISFYVHGSKIWIVDVDFQSGFHSMVDLPVTDNIPPAVTIDELTPDPTNDSTPTFTGTATDTLCSITSVEYNVDGGAWTAADAVDGTFDSPNEDYTFTTAALADGTHMVCVRATDAATNTTAEIDYATDEFTIDNTPPTVAIDALTPDPTNDDTPTFTGTATDTFSNITSVEYKVNDGAWTAATASDGTFDSLSEGYTFTTAALTDGVHTVYTRAIDAVGNTTPEIDYASDEFTLDTIAPTVTIDALTPDPTDDTTPTFTGMATDAPSTNIVSVEYKVDGGAWAAAAASDGAFDSTSEGYTFTTPELAEGLHMVHTRATDAAGNTTAEIDYASDEFTVETGVDETPPQVVDTSPAADATDQAINVAVWAAFNEDVTTVDLSGITISGATGVSATLDEGTDTITINHDDFAQGQTYTVTIPAGAVQDMAANPNEEYSWSFTTVYPESVYTLALGEGWNVMSTPIALDPSSDTWGEFIAIGDGLDVQIVYYYDAGIFQIAGASHVLKPCDAFYVYMNSADTSPVIPSPYVTGPPSKTMDIGWNLIGSAFLAVEEQSVEEALKSLYNAPGELLPWGYTQVISPAYNQPSWVHTRDGASHDMLVGKGYWVSMDNVDLYTGVTYTPWEP